MPFKDPKAKKEYDRKYRLEHKKETTAYMRKYYRENIDMFKKYSKKHYVDNRDEYLIRADRYYKDHKDEVISYQRTRITIPAIRAAHNALIRRIKSRDKLVCINHYSNNNNMCECCGEREYDLLTLDHIDGGGNRHKKSISGHTYSWLIRNKFPPIIRVLCMKCNFALGMKGYCPHKSRTTCKIRSPVYQIRWRERQKLECVSHYSNGKNECDCCGEKEIDFLTIDHIGGGGRKHRMATKSHTDRWLIKNGFPAGYRVLCVGCNWAYGKLGYCPHNKPNSSN